MDRKICFYPRIDQLPAGGVGQHIRGLQHELTARGWQIVTRPDADTLIHCHAQARAPRVDVYTNHGIYPLKTQMPAWQKEANYHIFANLRQAREVIAVSEWTADQWRRLTGVNPHIIPNGIDLAAWQSVPTGRWRARLQIPDQIPIIVWGKTNLSDVLDPTPALALAIARPDVRVVIPIDKRQLPTAPDNVICVGPQSFEAMQMLLADADVYLATVCENHAFQVLEAMALGKPIIGYDWGGTAETITSEHDGQLVAPGDEAGLLEALKTALGPQGAVWGAAARQTVAERFQLSKMVDQLEAIYMTVLEQKERERQPGWPKVSVIIPCYNKAPYVAETIESVLNQEQAPPFELIVVDDGSTDESVAVIKQALGNDPRARLIEQENAGVAAARNNGIQAARGEFITCVDADDVLDPNLLHRLASALEANPELGLAYSDMMVFGPQRQPHLVLCDTYDFAKLTQKNYIPCCNMFRRKAWQCAGGYKDINPSWEDYELWLNMGKLGWYGQRVPGGLFWYRKLPQTGRDHASRGQEWRLRALVNSYHRDLYGPMVSVVIPCYRQSRFLPDAIQSVMAQTFADYEIVVVDDGNQADEARRIQQIVERYDPHLVRLVVHEQNAGLAEARNSGIRAARGTWIVPLDADDKIAPEYLREVLKASNLDPKQMVYTDSYLWWQTDGEEDRLQLLEAEDYDFTALLRHISWACTVLYAKTAWQKVGGYKSVMSQAGGWEDWEFAISLGEQGICGRRVPQPLFYYRQHAADQMRHGADAVKPALREAIRRLHAGVYRGERPMGCCGKQRPQPVVDESLGEGEVLVRYSGDSMGIRQWACPSGRRYSFGIPRPLQRMPVADAAFLIQLPDFDQVVAA